MKHRAPRVRAALGCCFWIYACGGRSNEDHADCCAAQGGGGSMAGMGGSTAAGESGAGDAGTTGGGAGPGAAGEAGRASAGHAGVAAGGAGGVPAGQAGERSQGGIGTACADAGYAGISAGGITAGGAGTGDGAGGPDSAGGAGGADSSVLPLPAACRDLSGESPNGEYVIDPNGGDARDAFSVTCDLTSDGGGWTLIGRGQWWTSEADVLLSGVDAYLPAEKRRAIVQVSSSLFRVGEGAQRLFIQDSSALLELGFHYWRTNGASVTCTTDYADVDAGAMATTTAIGISCDALAVGSHTCGTLNGWILLHLNDPYNVSGAHPCSLGPGDRPTEAGLRTLWVR